MGVESVVARKSLCPALQFAASLSLDLTIQRCVPLKSFPET